MATFSLMSLPQRQLPTLTRVARIGGRDRLLCSSSQCVLKRHGSACPGRTAGKHHPMHESTVAPARVSGSLKIPAEQAECIRPEQHMNPHVRPASSKEIFGGQDSLPRGHYTCGLLGVKAHVLQQNACSMLPAHPHRLAKKPEHWTLQCAREHGDCQAPSGRAPATRSTTPDIAGQPILEGKA